MLPPYVPSTTSARTSQSFCRCTSVRTPAGTSRIQARKPSIFASSVPVLQPSPPGFIPKRTPCCVAKYPANVQSCTCSSVPFHAAICLYRTSLCLLPTQSSSVCTPIMCRANIWRHAVCPSSRQSHAYRAYPPLTTSGVVSHPVTHAIRGAFA